MHACVCVCVYVCMCVCHANVVQFCTVICHSAPRSTSIAITRAMKNVWEVSAAAEHGQPAAAEHGTNIAFANMDWKSGRHTGRNWKDHHAIWQRTTIETVPRSDWAMLQNHWDGNDRSGTTLHICGE